MPRPPRYSSTEEYRKEWRRLNPDKVAMQNLRTSKARRERGWRFRTEYKFNVEKYEEIFLKQDGKCAICLRPQSDFKYRFAVDHDHRTERIRGLLCFPCNTRLAIIEDSLFQIQAKEYLRRHSDALSK